MVLRECDSYFPSIECSVGPCRTRKTRVCDVVMNVQVRVSAGGNGIQEVGSVGSALVIIGEGVLTCWLYGRSFSR